MAYLDTTLTTNPPVSSSGRVFWVTSGITSTRREGTLMERRQRDVSLYSTRDSGTALRG